MPRRNRETPPQKQPEFENPDSGKRIELTRGLYALVSLDDYEFLSQFNWMAVPDPIVTGKFYARIPHKYSVSAFGSTEMHTTIWRMRGFKCRGIYHENNNGLDNRWENLTNKMPGWLLARFEEHRQAHPPQLRQRDSEQIPIENPDIGRLLTLRNGLVIALNKEDWDRISMFDWFVTNDKNRGRYTISRFVEGREKRGIAQEVLSLPSTTSITYLNKNPFDNRRVNIHILATRKNTPELSALGICWRGQDKNYIFRFLGPDKKRRYFSSPNLENVLSFAENYADKIRGGQFFCQRCQRFLGGENHNGICNECFPKTTAGKAAAAQVRIGQRKFWRKELDRIYMEFRDKPCTDCGKSFPAGIMQAHHVDRTQKEFEIPRLTRKKNSGTKAISVERLISELGKCVNLCPNCHLEREWGVNGSLRQHFKKKYGRG